MGRHFDVQFHLHFVFHFLSLAWKERFLQSDDWIFKYSFSGEQVFRPSKVEILEEDEILVLEFAETLPIGVGVLAIGFEGILNDKMKGFYRRWLGLEFICQFYCTPKLVIIDDMYTSLTCYLFC